MRERCDGRKRVPVSVLVITHNEEANIRACLQSVSWAGEVFVVDSGSTDRTVELARHLGACVWLHPFETYAKQRNYALDHLPFSHDWVLALDADERVPSALAKQITKAVSAPDPGIVGYYLNRRLIFLGQRLDHGGVYPTWILRLFRRDCGRFELRILNEHIILQGRAGCLSEPFEHVDAHPLSHWIRKHNHYAALQADEYFCGQPQAAGKSLEPRLLGSQAARKRWIRSRIWNHLPLLLRPFLLFLRNYVVNLGFLDGKAGLIYHVLWSFWYPFLTDTMVLEKRRAGAGATDVEEQVWVRPRPPHRPLSPS